MGEDVNSLYAKLAGLKDEELLAMSPDSPTLTMADVIPHPREQEFLDLQDEEVMYGGAVGGGKTEALLLWLLEGVAYENFSGLLRNAMISSMS